MSLASPPLAESPPRLCIYGTAPDTGNLGLSALCTAMVTAIAKRRPGTQLTVFSARSERSHARVWAQGSQVEYERLAAVNTRRFYRAESLWGMRICSQIGLRLQPGLRRIHRADALLDASGGDSFSDIYGMRRFWTVALPKLIALDQGTRLVLLPQTYGPFSRPKARDLARSIVRRAAAAWARDDRSFAVLRELLGSAFDPGRHRVGVDLAFLLEARTPDRPELRVDERRQPDATLVGVNVSGLLYHGGEVARAKYGLASDYRDVVHALLTRLLREGDVQVLLVPHVIPASETHYESDVGACRAARDRLTDEQRARAHLVEPPFDEAEIKWIIGQCDWFCGTRMHSTIAALSSRVPCACIAYSDKARGVFETCGAGEAVADARRLAADELVEAIWQVWRQRDQMRRDLERDLPGVERRAEAQVDDILRIALGSRAP